MLRSGPRQASRYLPVAVSTYFGGKVSGAKTRELEAGFASHAAWDAAIARTWALVPQWMRDKSATGGIYPGVPSPLRTFHADTLTRGQALLRASGAGSFGGVYLGPEASPERADSFLDVNGPETRTTTLKAGGVVSEVILPTQLHEYGHHVDKTWAARFLGEPVTDPRADLMARPEWWALWEAASALGAPAPPVDWQQSYGFTSASEWFAEVFAARVVINHATPSLVANVTATRYKPTLIHYLCGGDSAIYADVSALFTETFPGIDSPVPLPASFTGWA